MLPGTASPVFPAASVLRFSTVLARPAAADDEAYGKYTCVYVTTVTSAAQNEPTMSWLCSELDRPTRWPRNRTREMCIAMLGSL